MSNHACAAWQHSVKIGAHDVVAAVVALLEPVAAALAADGAVVGCVLAEAGISWFAAPLLPDLHKECIVSARS